MKKIISLVFVCILILSMCACNAQPKLVDTDSAESTTTTSATSGSGLVFKPGDTAVLNGVTVNFIGVQTSTGSEYNTPAEGKVFVLCEFEITNGTSEDLVVSSIMNFQGYCDDYACEFSLGALMEKGDKTQLDGTIATGKKLKGVLGYEVPTDWKELEITYTPDILSDSKFVFVATNN